MAMGSLLRVPLWILQLLPCRSACVYTAATLNANPNLHGLYYSSIIYVLESLLGLIEIMVFARVNNDCYDYPALLRTKIVRIKN